MCIYICIYYIIHNIYYSHNICRHVFSLNVFIERPDNPKKPVPLWSTSYIF